MKNNLLIHVPHSSMYIPQAYRQTALISQAELDKENLFMCDTGIRQLIPPALEANTIVFPYSRLYCDVERFRDGTEPMGAYGMGYIYRKTSTGRDLFNPSESHIAEISAIYDAHHDALNRRTTEILNAYGKCLIIDLHSFSDEAVDRLFGYKHCPDICIGTEPDYYDKELVMGIEKFCARLGLSTRFNYPYRGSLVPNQYYGRKNTNIVSIMLEINKRIL